jgi:uncharacterized protein (DUF1778 family)
LTAANRPLRESRFQIRLAQDEQRQFNEAAERQHLSVSAWIRLCALHAAQGQAAPNGPRKAQRALTTRGTSLQIRLTEDEKQLFSEAAARHQLSVSAWMRSAALRAAKARPSHQTKFMPVCT